MNAGHVVMVALGVPGLVVLIALVTWTVMPWPTVRVEPQRIQNTSCQTVRRLQVDLRNWSSET